MTARLAAICCSLMLLSASPAAAQSFAGLQIGDNAEKAKALGLPSDTGRYQEYDLTKWRLPNGNDLSISADANGQIEFIETDWGATAAGAAAGMFGFTYGQTSRSAIRKKLGSNGLSFRNRAPVMNTASGLLMMNSYEVGTVIVTFLTLIAPADIDKAKTGELGDHARLVAISLASPGYAAHNWGMATNDPAYKKLPAP